MKHLIYKSSIVIGCLGLILFLGWNSFSGSISLADSDNNQNGARKPTTARDGAAAPTVATLADRPFTLEELNLDLKQEIFNNSSAIYLQILKFARKHPERLKDIWRFSQKFNDDNSHVLKGGLLSLLIEFDFKLYQETVSQISKEEFSCFSYSLSEELSRVKDNFSNSAIIDLFTWHRNNPDYEVDLKFFTKKLSTHELLELQISNDVKNIDDCDFEIARRISEGQITHNNSIHSYKPTAAVSYSYGMLAGSKVFDIQHLDKDPMDYLMRDSVLRGAADKMASKMDANEIVANIEKFDPENIKRIFAYGAGADRETTSRNINELLKNGINVDYAVMGFVENIVNSSPNLSNESKTSLETWIDMIKDPNLKTQIRDNLNRSSKN